jgi:hypothetical protein
MTLEEEIAGLKYLPFGADQNEQAQKIVGLFSQLYPTSPLCKTCRADIMKMYSILKTYQAPPQEMEKPKFKYRFTEGIEPFRPFGERMVYSNENLTDEIAERLIAEYPNLKRDNVIVEVPGYEAPKPEADQAETPAPKKKSAKKEPK